MRNFSIKAITTLVLFSVLSSFILFQKENPVLFIVGDSTVRNGDGTGKGNQWGWGSFIAGYFDTTKLGVENHAIGGRSSRTFITEGRWERVLSRMKKGDYVIMQFGHNDGGPLDDTARARGSIRGFGEESKEIYNPITKKQEVVYTYGHYIRQYIRETKAKGAFPIVCSPIPRNNWKDGKVTRSESSYAGWAKQVAKEEGVDFIDLNELVAVQYESLGADAVKLFFPGDHTHTNKEGAELNAQIVVNAIKAMKTPDLARLLN
jgi:rhamnogalacturonan acetylesterase